MSWPLALVAVIAVGLLTALAQVARDAARQAEAQQRTRTAHAEATWQCRAMGERLLRQNCLARLAVARQHGRVAASTTDRQAGR